MFLTLWCLMTLLFGALLLGTTFAPMLWMTARDELGRQWLQAHALYRAGAGFAAVLEPIALLAAAVLMVLLRDWRPALLAALAGTACLAIAYLLFWAFTRRINGQIVQWLPGALPEDWQTWRSKWETSQRVRFGLQLTGFSLLALATLISPMDQE